MERFQKVLLNQKYRGAERAWSGKGTVGWVLGVAASWLLGLGK